MQTTTEFIFDRWGVDTLSEIFKKTGIAFREEWVEKIKLELETIIPLKDWKCKKDDVESVIEKRITKIIGQIFNEYFKCLTNDGYLHISPGLPEVGEYEIIFFYIYELVHAGYFGTLEEAKDWFLEMETIDDEAHKKNVEYLFSLVY